MKPRVIVFDLDGVLFDGVKIHFDSLNAALAEVDERYVISEDDAPSFNGIPTRRKLEKLADERDFPRDMFDRVWSRKQEIASQSLGDIDVDERSVKLLETLKGCGYRICVASNSIRDTVETVLTRKGLMPFVDFYMSNEDVVNGKPDPEMYVKCFEHEGVSPGECIVLEDSFVGRTAAHRSGAHVLPVKNPGDVTFEKIDRYASFVRKGGNTRSLTVVIPMAGRGSRFSSDGYALPKPFIQVFGKPMVAAVIENIGIHARYVAIARGEHVTEYGLESALRDATCDNFEIVVVDEVTQGSACTVLRASDTFDGPNPMILANSDQYLEWNPYEFLDEAIGVDGLISCFEDDDPKWSFARVDDRGFVTEVAEKRVISSLATTGVYYFGKGSDYAKYARSMISLDVRTNGEFYNCPVYNEMLKDEGKLVRVHMCRRMWGIGTPGDLGNFVDNFPLKRIAVLFVGRVKFYEKSLEWWKKKIVPKYDVDFFCSVNGIRDEYHEKFVSDFGVKYAEFGEFDTSGSYGLSLYKHASGVAPMNLLSMFYNLENGMRMIGERELDAGAYDAVVYARADMVVDEDLGLDIAFPLDENVVHVPEGGDYLDGLNDQFAYGTSGGMRAYGRVYGLIPELCTSCGKHNTLFHQETILSKALNLQNIETRRFEFPFSLNRGS